jgi:stage II sporulation protein D
VIRPYAPAVLILVGLLSCTSGGVTVRQPSGLPSPSSRETEIKVGLVVGAPSATLGGTTSVAITEPDGSPVATIVAGQTWRVSARPGGLVLTGAGGLSTAAFEALTLVPADDAPIWVNGKPYRGRADVLRDRTGLTVVNRLPMESYLLGVVSAEMGRRNASEQAALQAQAVVSRTYAFRNLRRWRSQGFDLYATVSDQAYGGMRAETPEGRAAVNETRGRVLTHNGAPIEAFYYSTCGGRTADGYEVFRGASRPYLRSGADVTPDGTAYCSISPRYQWRQEWSGSSLRAVLSRYLPNPTGVRANLDRLADIRVTRRTGSGRVDQVVVTAGGSDVLVDGQSKIRQVLRTPGGDLLRSTAFTLVVSGAGNSVSHLVAEGTGAGHGVGLCQWGAVGRAREGQGLEQILAAYYPGTRLERRY